MNNLHKLLEQDVRFKDALSSCMNCGMCTAVCPAAEFYDYDPRRICDVVQRGDDEQIEALLKSDTIWYCGQCMSCRTRCPRGNVPGEVVSVLRKVSQEMGYFRQSVKGRQQVELMKGIGSNILEMGYCVHPDRMPCDKHPEQGPVWVWYKDNIRKVAPRIGANYHGTGPGALRTIPEEVMKEIRSIFEVTGGTDFRKKVMGV